MYVHITPAFAAHHSPATPSESRRHFLRTNATVASGVLMSSALPQSVFVTTSTTTAVNPISYSLTGSTSVREGLYQNMTRVLTGYYERQMDAIVADYLASQRLAKQQASNSRTNDEQVQGKRLNRSTLLRAELMRALKLGRFAKAFQQGGEKN